MSIAQGEWVEPPSPVGAEERIVDRYTMKDCGLLAAAISDKTGWPIWCIFEEYDRPEPNIGWLHALVQLPCGCFLDIEGVHDTNEAIDRWDNYFDRYLVDAGITPMTQDMLDDMRKMPPEDIETTWWADRLIRHAKEEHSCE